MRMRLADANAADVRPQLCIRSCEPMFRIGLSLLTVAFLALSMPSTSAAQGRGPTAGRPGTVDWWEPRPYSQSGYASRHTVRKGAPPYCRSRRGHPVHGWSWCVEKGFVRPQARKAWRPYRPNRVVVIRERPRRFVRSGVVFQANVMIDLLGVQLYRDVRRWGDRLGRRGRPVARWVPIGRRGWVIQVWQNGFPVAELVDPNGDRRLDEVWLFEPERLGRERYDDDRYDDDRYDGWRSWEDNRRRDG